MIELKNYKTICLGRASGGERYSLDAFIGAVQMREPGGEWHDIRPQLVRDTDGWHIERAPYYAEIKDDGTRLFCPDRNEKNKYLRLPSPVYFASLAKNPVSNPARLDRALLLNQITIPTDWGEYRIIFSNTGMHFEVLFSKAPPSDVFGKDSPKILLDAEASGYDIEQLIASKTGLGIPRPKLVVEDLKNENNQRRLDWGYKNGQLELGFDLGGLQFPLLLKNTTLNLQVEAGADDGYAKQGEYLNNYNTVIYVGKDAAAKEVGGFYRFTGITIPQGATIDDAYLELYEAWSNPGSQTKLRADDQNNSGQITSQADYFGRSLTTAGTDADGDPGVPGWYQIDATDIIQELVTSYDYDNEAIQFLHRDDGSTNANYRASYAYENSGTYAPRLHIEYTAGGATEKTAADTGSGAEVSSLLAAMAKAESGGGTDAAALIAGLITGETGLGTDSGMIVGLKPLFSNDGGVSRDALKALLAASGSGSDMKLPGRQGKSGIPSKGVNL
jgi:hypothetical protein